MADQYLWTEDPYLIVLFKLLIKVKTIYNSLIREHARSDDNLKRHKFSVRWLIEEITQACKNYPHWYRGRQRLGSLVDLKLELEEYFDKVLNKPIEETRILYGELNHEFYATFVQLERLFQD